MLEYENLNSRGVFGSFKFFNPGCLKRLKTDLWILFIILLITRQHPFCFLCLPIVTIIRNFSSFLGRPLFIDLKVIFFLVTSKFSGSFGSSCFSFIIIFVASAVFLSVIFSETFSISLFLLTSFVVII
jgi:hypothetical protein